MEHRPEPFLAERVWVHPSALSLDGVVSSTEFDDAQRPIRVGYTDGQSETYTYDREGRLIGINEHPMLWSTVGGSPQRFDTGGPLRVEHDEHGPVRIATPHHVVWERCEEPWPDLLRRGAESLAARCVDAIAGTDVAPGVEVFGLMLIYVSDGGLHTVVSAGLESERSALLADDDPESIAYGLWYPEAPGLSFVEVEDDETLDDLLLREAALNDRREAQRTVLTEVAKLLARRDWSGLLTPTEDFVVYIAEHDEGFTKKHESVREVNPSKRLAIWDARWPPGVPRED
jgi:YD repeat-containing protein